MRRSTEELLKLKLSPPPFMDYVVAICRADARRSQSALLSRTFPTMQITEWIPRGGRDGSLAILISAPPELEVTATEDSLRFFEGYLLDDDLRYALDHELTAFLDHPQRRLRSPLTTARGLFSIGASNGEAFVLIPDALGMNVVFFGEQNGASFVSNRYSLMAKVFADVPVDPAHLSLAFARRIKLGDDTSIAGVRSVPFGCWLEITRDRPCIVRGLRRRMEEVSGDHTQYAGLLERGIEEVHSNLISSQVTKPSLFQLSGGRDSRVVLSAILARDLRRDFLFHTNATGDSDELIATHLIDQFKLERRDRGTTGGTSKFYFEEDQIIDWIAEFACEHRYPDISFVPGPVWRSDISLTGGMSGETFRGFYTEKLAQKKGVSIAALQTTIQDLIRVTANTEVLSDLGIAALKEQTSASMPSFPDEQLTRIDLLYTFYRNRFHFGFSARARNLNAPSRIVLYSPSLVLASMCIPAEDRACGRVAFDFMSRAWPSLLYIGGTYDPWPIRFFEAQSAQLRDQCPLLPEWAPPQPEPCGPAPTPLVSQAEARRRILARAQDDLKWLRDSVDLSRFLNFDVLESKLKNAERKRSTFYPLLIAARAAWSRQLLCRS